MDNKKLLYGFIFLLLILAVFFTYKFKYESTTGLVSAQTSEGPLFQVHVDVPEEYKEVKAGEELLTSIIINNLGEGSRMDVILSYSIKDADGNELLKKSETVAVEKENSFVRHIILPLNIKNGKYNLEVSLLYADNKEAKSKVSFKIVA